MVPLSCVLFEVKLSDFISQEIINSKNTNINGNGFEEFKSFLSAFDKYVKNLLKYLKNRGALDYIGKTIDGVDITASLLMGAGHLVGNYPLFNDLKNGFSPDTRLITPSYGNMW